MNVFMVGHFSPASEIEQKVYFYYKLSFILETFCRYVRSILDHFVLQT